MNKFFLPANTTGEDIPISKESNMSIGNTVIGNNICDLYTVKPSLINMDDPTSLGISVTYQLNIPEGYSMISKCVMYQNVFDADTNNKPIILLNDATTIDDVDDNYIKISDIDTSPNLYVNARISCTENTFGQIIVKCMITLRDSEGNNITYCSPATRQVRGALIVDTRDRVSFTSYGEIVAKAASALGNPTNKNLLKITAQSTTRNGITFTINEDKSVTVNGTATTTTYIDLGLITPYSNATYILSGCPEGGSTSSYYLRAFDIVNWVDRGRDTGSSASTTVPNNNTIVYRLYVAEGTTVENVTFYPMVRYYGIYDNTYEPYKDSIPDVINNNAALNRTAYGDVSKNLLKFVSCTLTSNNELTLITNSEDGSLTISGTNTSSSNTDMYSYFNINDDATYSGYVYGSYNTQGYVLDRDMIFSFDATTDTPNVIAAYRKSAGGSLVYASHKSVNSTLKLLAGYELVSIYIQVGKGETVDYTVYPMLRYADVIDDTVEPHRDTINDKILQNKSDITINKTTLGYSCKNLLIPRRNVGYTETVLGVTYTINNDYSVSANGTATGEGGIVFSIVDLKAGTYILSTQTAATIQIYTYVDNVSTYHSGININANIDSMLSLDKDDKYIFKLYIGNGKVCDNFTIYPMLRYANITDSTYEPYKPSLAETSAKIETTVGATCKNLLNNNAVSTTSNGITFTVNADKSITINGTATQTNFFVLGNISLTAGKKYILTGGYSTNCSLKFDIPNIFDTGSGLEYTPNKNTNDRIVLRIASGEILSNITIYPMVRYAEITDNTYEPYKMPISEYNAYVKTTLGTENKNLFNHDAWVNAITTATRGTISRNKNMITITATSDDAYTYPTVASDDAYKIPVKPCTKYILSWNSWASTGNTLDGSVYVFFNGVNTYGSYVCVNNSVSKQLTFTTKPDTTFITVRVGVTKSGNSIVYSDMMLRYADITDSTYKPYIEPLSERTAYIESTIGTPNKNLLDFANIECVATRAATYTKTDNSITVTSYKDTISTWWGYVTYRVSSLQVGRTYTFSANISNLTIEDGGEVFIRFAYDMGGTNTVPNSNIIITKTGHISTSFTPTTSTIYLVFYANPSADFYNNTFTADNIMLRYSEISDSTYEPYREPISESISSIDSSLGTRCTNLLDLKNPVEYGKTILYVCDDWSYKLTSNGTWAYWRSLIHTVPGKKYTFRYTITEKNSSVPGIFISDYYSINGTRQNLLGSSGTGCNSSVGTYEYEFTAISDKTLISICVNNSSTSSTTDYMVFAQTGVYPADIPSVPYSSYTPSLTTRVDNALDRFGGKNLLKLACQNKTDNGITFTVNADGSVTVNGTNTNANTIYYKLANFALRSGTYLISGYPNGTVNTNNGYLQITDVVIKSNDYILKVHYPMYRYDFFIAVKSGCTLNNVVFKPMIRSCEYLDNTFEKYNRGLETQVAINRATVGTECKNLLPYTAVAGKISGVTVTVDTERRVTFSGTTTASFTHVFGGSSFSLEFDRDVFIVGANRLSNLGYMAKIYDPSTSKNTYENINIHGLIVPAGKRITQIYVQQNSSGKSVDASIYPMIVYADVDDLTYEPYKPSLQEQLNSALARIEALETALASATSETGDETTTE